MSRTTLKWANPPTGVLNAPVYLAQTDGAIRLADADIVVTDTANGSQHTQALVQGRYDMGHIGAPPLMAALSRTREYALVGTGLHRHPPHSMLVADGVGRFGRLRGKPIGINRRNTCSHSIVRTLLAREGMDESDVRLLELGGDIQSLESIRQLSAAVLWEPYTTTAIRALGWKVFAAGASIWSPSRYCTMLYARRRLLEESPDLVIAVLAAYAGWVRTAQADQEASARAVISRLPRTPAEDVRAGVAREAPAWSSDTSLDHGLLERTVGELEVQSVVSPGFRLDDAIVSLGA